MDQIRSAQQQIHALLSSIDDFIAHSAESATYKAPIIDWHHPDSYRQSGITGLKKFLSTVETERDYIDSLAASKVPPKEVASNLPHLLAVWEQVEKAEWPIVCISQVLECGDNVQAKVDVVAKGGEEWIKVNTMKESRLMAEFREQDSYINSDYDSDYEVDSGSASASSSSQAGSSRVLSRPSLNNSAIEQVSSLVNAAKSYPRIPGFPPPRLKYVLNRLEENPEGGYVDPRVKETFEAIRAMGVDLVLASDVQPEPKRIKQPTFVPTKKILLDLSVVVALCCDSTHQPLPESAEELEARFRALRLNSQGGLELSPHIPVTKDLRDQLDWEMRHPLIREMQERLTPLVQGAPTDEIEFWVTDEVKNRLPAIADIIGGEEEKARAKKLFDGGDFWGGSRWKGKEGILGEMKVRVLPPAIDGSTAVETCNYGDEEGKTISPFKKGFTSICRSMLEIVEIQSSTSSLPPQPPGPKPNKRNKGRRRRQTPTGITIASRLPSAHTLRTFLVGFEKGWTVLTNNRGAVGKVIREMRIGEGLGYGECIEGNDGERGEVRVWVVNPSSLAEWRRKEVEQKNKEVMAYVADPSKEAAFRSWLKDGPEAMEQLSLRDEEAEDGGRESDQ
ncbi:hypothetical protein I316_04769 [Kwoniella heveanensis BCC8398]|uniref:DUF1308 domain-containing protein n=1 Tax=Kwoniella heveanensis BCC8398 TaxID=1296120 RepID=A0A1B9GS70_9TREE|nr:hypothetical protein I316_04769 [Kwoniella heveanensis BCC8398]